MAEPILGFFVADSASPEENLNDTVQRMKNADAWIAVTVRHPPLMA